MDPTGLVATWNPGAERLSGYTKDEIVGQHFSRFFTPEDQADGKPAVALSVARTSGCFEEEGWRVRKDGTRFWVNAVIQPLRNDNGQITGFSRITRDMTGKRAADEALSASERRLRLFMDNVVHHAMFMLDVNGIIMDWNRGAERIKGYQWSEIIGQHYSVFFTPEDQAARRPEHALETARTSGRFEAEGWRVRKDGTRFWANVVLTPMWDEHGKLFWLRQNSP